MSKNSSGKYYQKNKEEIQKKSRGRYQSLSGEGKKNGKREHGCKLHKNRSEIEKQKLAA